VNAADTRLTVARRQVPHIAKEAKTPDDAVGIVREAVEADPTLKAMGENILGPEEALELTRAATAAERPALVKALVRKRIARAVPKLLGQAERMDALGRGEADPQPGHDEAFVEGRLEELRERDEL
jgi:hypothetical protein